MNRSSIYYTNKKSIDISEHKTHAGIRVSQLNYTKKDNSIYVTMLFRQVYINNTIFTFI